MRASTFFIGCGGVCSQLLKARCSLAFMSAPRLSCMR